MDYNVRLYSLCFNTLWPLESTKVKTPHTTEVHRIPNLVLAVEEPELYQHPSRQRHLASVLRRLAEGSISSVAHRTQVVYTHPCTALRRTRPL